MVSLLRLGWYLISPKYSSFILNYFSFFTLHQSEINQHCLLSVPRLTSGRWTGKKSIIFKHIYTYYQPCSIDDVESFVIKEIREFENEGLVLKVPFSPVFTPRRFVLYMHGAGWRLNWCWIVNLLLPLFHPRPRHSHDSDELYTKSTSSASKSLLLCFNINSQSIHSC